MAKKIKLNDKSNDWSGSNKPEIVFGNGGDDNLSGGGGNDKLFGGDGNDLLRGGSGDDILGGGAGNDTMLGGSGDDTITAGAGDTVDGGVGDDLVKITGNFADATVAMDGDYYAITIGTDTFRVKNAESFQFTDGIFGTDDLDEKVTGSTGQTFILTSSVDNFSGSTGDDTFIAGDAGGLATLSAGDILAGKDGADTLNIINTAGVKNGENFAGATVTGIETVNFTAGASAQTLDVSGNADVTQVWAKNGTDSAITLAKTQTAGITGTVTAAAAQTFTFTSAAGATDSINLALNAAVIAASGVKIDSIETINVAATGKNSFFAFDSDATKLVVTGDGSVDFGTLTASLVTTIDASTNKGGITADNSAAGAAVEKITGGEGNDSYTTLFANLTKDDTIALGAGTDTLSFKDATDLSASALALTGVTGVETLRVTGGAFAFKVDADLVSQTTFVHDSTGAFTGTNFSSTDKLVIGDVVAGASTVNMKLGQTTFNLALEGTKTDESDASAGITVTGASTVNVDSSGFADAGASNLLDLKTDANGTINVTGARDLILDLAVNAGVTGLSVVASTFTGKLDVTGSANGDSIVAGSGADTIEGAVGADTLTGGAGTDTFVFATGDTGITLATADTITDFTTADDSLTTSRAAGAATIVDGTALADFAAFAAAADTAFTVAVGNDDQYVAYNAAASGNAWIAIDENNDGLFGAGDTVIVLTGVNTSTEIVVGDFL